MKKLLLITVLVFLILNLIGQVIPEDRRVDWESAIQNITYFQPDVQLNVMDFGATGNGVTNDQPAIMSAIESLNNHPGYVYFPEGDYLIEEPIILKDSCILKGSGSEFSTLIFDMGETSTNCISISKVQTSDFVAITGGYNKGNNLITISDISQFSVSDYIEIRQENGVHQKQNKSPHLLPMYWLSVLYRTSPLLLHWLYSTHTHLSGYRQPIVLSYLRHCYFFGY